jgi:transposase
MTKTQVEVITSVERRRRWTAAEKERLVAASLEPVVSALAREAGIHPSQLYGWRRKLCARRGVAPGFASVRIVGETAVPGLLAPLGMIEIELAGGTRVRITGAVDAATVSAAVAALAPNPRCDILVNMPWSR